jgi:hypothetical protein
MILLNKIGSEESGQGMVEYGLILTFVVVFALGTMRTSIGNDLARRIQHILQAIDL